MAKKPGMKNVTFLWGVIAALGLAAGGIVLALFLNLIQTETYYILNEDAPARAMIYPEMLEPVTVNKGGAPEAAIGLEEVQNGGTFTNFPLLAGDILTASNVGGREDVSVGIPDEWVITNFSVSADDAVGGRIQRGYYFDMLVTDEGGSFYPFVNVLALDTTVDLSGASSADAANTEEAKSGMTSQYVVGMSPENAAKLHSIVSKYSNIKLVLSPRANEYQKPNMQDYTGIFNFNVGDAPVNLGEGTDYTFTQLERDGFGRLIEELKNCGDGNAVISKEELCDTPKSGSSSTQENQSPAASAPVNKDAGESDSDEDSESDMNTESGS